ncbi:hypothetical protein V6C32_03655 [Desulforamulus ruminis]|uniref:hypothetical protein n=1 Tax=Desulforamulus ruminis TaxID=1564 RepID=UPI002FDAB272
MKRIKVGDVFEITTPNGKAYFQYVHNNPEVCELIRILPGVYFQQPRDLLSLINKKELYLIHFPLKAAYKEEIVNLIGSFDLPDGFQLPKNMRSDHIDGNGNRIWHIIDYDTWQRESIKILSDEQKKLSPWEIWNDTLLIERISEEWTLEKWV